MSSAPRLFTPQALPSGSAVALTPAAAQHARVLRLQPGDAITLFNGLGGESAAQVLQMGKRDVQVLVGEHRALEREAARALHLVVALMANERMDWLVEKATELGATSLQPVVSSRSVLRLDGERAERRVARWELAVIAACEQCGRNRLPRIHPILALGDWFGSPAAQAGGGARAMLSLAAGTQSAQHFAASLPADAPLTLLTGPEGGLSPAEESQALAAGFAPLSLGPRVLRAETAAMAATTLFCTH